jgi:adenylosuccinate lyase
VGVDDPYTLLKKASRGQKPTKESLVELVNGLNIDQKIKDRCNAMESVNYIGDAVRICDLVLERTRAIL